MCKAIITAAACGLFLIACMAIAFWDVAVRGDYEDFLGEDEQ